MNRSNGNKWVEASAVVLAVALAITSMGAVQHSFAYAASSLQGGHTFLGLAMAIAEAAVKAQEQSSQSKAAQAFDKLKTLNGRWEAPLENGKAEVEYELVAGGSVLVSHDKIANQPEMLTVYHVDGDRLVLTHYCSAGNQPHLQAEPFDPASNELRFQFVNGGNLANANVGHMHRAVFKFNGPDEVTQEWTWYQDGKTGFSVPLKLKRVK